MNEQELARIEKVVGCDLPEAYSRLLANMPEELLAIMKLMPAEDRAVFTDVRTIVRFNKLIREPDYEFEDEYGETRRFDPTHVIIGANGGGDLYVINAKHKRTRVQFWCHETGTFLKNYEAKNLDAFIRRVFASAAELALDGLNLR